MLYPTGLAPRRAKRLSEGVPKGICYALVPQGYRFAYGTLRYIL